MVAEENPLIGVVILNFRNALDTVECVKSVLNSDYSFLRVYVVDNDSADGSLETIAREFGGEAPRVRIIASVENGGFSKGNNQGVRRAVEDGADFVWILNNDTKVSPECARRLVECWRRNDRASQKIGPIGAKVLDFDYPHRVQGIGGKFSLIKGSTSHIAEGAMDDDSICEAWASSTCDYAMGVSLFVSSGFLAEVGLLCEDYFLYFEELDWSRRASKFGWKPGVCLEATVYHRGGATIGSSVEWASRSELSDIEGQRSKFRFLSKHYPWMVPVAVVLLLPVFWNRIRRGQAQRIGRMLYAALSGAVQK